MQAIILAAGMGKRLKELTQDNTKCMVKVNGISLIERLLKQLERYNLTRIIIVTGYKSEKLIDYIGTLDIKTPISYIDNPIYATTNNIYSLSLAKEWLKCEDTLLFESDLIFEDSVIDMLVNDPRDTLAVTDRYAPWMDGTCLKLRDDDGIAAFIPGREFNAAESAEYYKTVNVYKFSKAFSERYYVPFLTAYMHAMGVNEYYEQVLRVIALLDPVAMRGLRLSGQRWYEIDNVTDLHAAEQLFS